MTKEKLTRAEISKRYRERNPEKYKESQKKFRDNNKQYMSERQRKYQLKFNYGITEADYGSMLAMQTSRCGICGTDKLTGKWKRFAVDHDHTTGRVRGLLCNECNRGIGLLKDNPDILRKAAEYIDYHKAITQQEREQRKENK